jgi:anti-sigma factor RsiW
MSIPAPKLSEGECKFSRCVGLYADGELDASRAMDVETHLLSCTACAERLELLRATRVSLKRCAFARMAAPAGLRARVALACTSTERTANATPIPVSGVFDPVKSSLDGQLLEHRQLLSGEAPQETYAPRLVRLRYAVAMAAAAGIAFAMGAWRLQDGRLSGSGDGSQASANPTPDADGSRAAQAGGATPIATGGVTVGNAKFERMLEDLVALHANPLPPETTNPDELQRFDPLVGVPVRRPAFRPQEVRFHGARIHALPDRRAAVLQYTIRGGHRITMYVFNPEAMPVNDTRLQPRVVSERPVYVGHFRGYSIAATEKRGVGYALASDLDDDKCAQMVASVAH